MEGNWQCIKICDSNVMGMVKRRDYKRSIYTYTPCRAQQLLKDWFRGYVRAREAHGTVKYADRFTDTAFLVGNFSGIYAREKSWGLHSGIRAARCFARRNFPKFIQFKSDKRYWIVYGCRSRKSWAPTSHDHASHVAGWRFCCDERRILSPKLQPSRNACRYSGQLTTTEYDDRLVNLDIRTWWFPLWFLLSYT